MTSSGSSAPSSSFGPGLIIAGSVLGISALCWRGFSRTREQSEKGETYSQPAVITVPPLSSRTRRRIAATYGYALGGVGVTTAFATAAFKLGGTRALLQASTGGTFARIGLAVGMLLPAVGSVVAMRLLPKKRKVARHAAWVAFFAPCGLSASVVGYMSPVLVGQAALVSGAVIGSLSAVALCSPSRRFLSWGGVVTAGLGAICAVSIGQLIWPESIILRNFAVYGGLLVFCASLLYGSSKLITAAETAPEEDELTPAASEVAAQQPFDPLLLSLDVYLDGLNIFFRVLEILNDNN